MRYSKSKVVEDRTLNYRFSVDSKSDQALKDLRRQVKIHNKEQRHAEDIKEPHFIRVRVRGRGPHIAPDGTRYNRSIPDSLAKHWDVYVVRDTDAMTAYNKRKTKPTGSMMAKVLDHIGNLNKLNKLGQVAQPV